MDKALAEKAYLLARENYNKAFTKTLKSLEKAFRKADSDDVYAAANRGMKLFLEAETLAWRVWNKSLKYEKAEEILINQFSDVPDEVCRQAFKRAYIDTR